MSKKKSKLLSYGFAFIELMLEQECTHAGDKRTHELYIHGDLRIQMGAWFLCNVSNGVNCDSFIRCLLISRYYILLYAMMFLVCDFKVRVRVCTNVNGCTEYITYTIHILVLFRNFYHCH